MKTKTSVLVMLISLVLLGIFAPSHALAQTVATANDGTVIAQTAPGADVVSALITEFAVKHSWILAVLSAIGTLRAIFKPIVGVLERFATSSPNATYQARLQQAEASWAFKAFCWLLDYTASVKVGTQKALPPAA